MQKVMTVVSGNVTIKKIIDTLTFDELMTDLREFYGGNATKYLIWVIPAGASFRWTNNELEMIADFVKLHAYTRVGGKTAFVAPSQHEFGICRVLDAFGEHRSLPFETRTFRELSDAAEWIGVDGLPAID